MKDASKSASFSLLFEVARLAADFAAPFGLWIWRGTAERSDGLEHRYQALELSERAGAVELVEGMPSLAGGAHQARGLEHAQVACGHRAIMRGVAGNGSDVTAALQDERTQDGDASGFGQRSKEGAIDRLEACGCSYFSVAHAHTLSACSPPSTYEPTKARQAAGRGQSLAAKRVERLPQIALRQAKLIARNADVRRRRRPVQRAKQPIPNQPG